MGYTGYELDLNTLSKALNIPAIIGGPGPAMLFGGDGLPSKTIKTESLVEWAQSMKDAEGFIFLYKVQAFDDHFQVRFWDLRDLPVFKEQYVEQSA